MNKKTFIMGIIFGGIIFGTIGVFAITVLEGNQISYDNKNSNLSSNDVQGAIDELNDKTNYGNASASDIANGKYALVNGQKVVGNALTYQDGYNIGYSKGKEDGIAEVKSAPVDYDIPVAPSYILQLRAYDDVGNTGWHFSVTRMTLNKSTMQYTSTSQDVTSSSVINDSFVYARCLYGEGYTGWLVQLKKDCYYNGTKVSAGYQFNAYYTSGNFGVVNIYE